MGTTTKKNGLLAVLGNVSRGDDWVRYLFITLSTCTLRLDQLAGLVTNFSGDISLSSYFSSIS